MKARRIESEANQQSVFVLQHSYELDGCDETKLIGVYGTREAAYEAIRRLETESGFRDHRKGFHVDEYRLDQDHWTEGFRSG